MRELLRRLGQPTFALKRTGLYRVGRVRIGRNLKRTIDRDTGIIKTPEIIVKLASHAAQQRSVSWVQFERFLVVCLSLSPAPQTPENEAQVLQQIGVIRQQLFRPFVRR